jgi:hypothetical protein
LHLAGAKNVYAVSGLAIRPKTKLSKLEYIKEMILALGKNPNQYSTREALAQGATIFKTADD